MVVTAECLKRLPALFLFLPAAKLAIKGAETLIVITSISGAVYLIITFRSNLPFLNLLPVRDSNLSIKSSFPARQPLHLNQCCRDQSCFSSPLKSVNCPRNSVTEDFQLTDRVLPAVSSVWLWYASANRDERHYANPGELDLDRNLMDKVGLEDGAHSCIGKHLAQVEIEPILLSRLKYVGQIEVDDFSCVVNT